MNDVYRRVWPVRRADAGRRSWRDLRHPEALIEITALVVPRGVQRDIVNPHAWRPSPNPYSYAIRSGRTLFMSGLVPRSPLDGTLIPGDVRTQTTAILENAKELLKAADMNLGDIINAKIFLTDASQFEAMHSVYRTYFPIDPPACTTAVTQLMNPGFSVEMTLMAVRSKYRLTMPPGPEHGPLQLSAFVQAEGRLFVSGMRGDAPEARHNAGAQALEALQRLTRLLKRARFTWRELREIAVYVTGHFARAGGDVRAGAVPAGIPPAIRRDRRNGPARARRPRRNHRHLRPRPLALALSPQPRWLPGNCPFPQGREQRKI